MASPRDPYQGPWRLRFLGLGSSVATVGLLSLLLLGPTKKQAAMPGPLSVNHASLAESCDACHAVSAEAVQDLRHGLATTAMSLDQSARCGACHDLGPHPLAAHGWAPAQVERKRAATADSRTSFVPSDAQGRLACATCHREHRGRNADPKTLNDGRCQACHVARFDDFEHDHPEFEDYAHARRTRIVFDHGAHIYRHFRSQDVEHAPAACTDCHAADLAGRRMLVSGYEQACAGCHASEIRGAGQVAGNGIPFLSLPALDTLTLEERGVGIGHWPADSALTETELTPFVRLLLGDAAELQELDRVDLLDLSDASDEDLAAVERIAWEVKTLFGELVTGGHQALVERLESALERPLEQVTAQALLERFPEDLLRAALGTWVPRLEEELAAHRSGQAVPTDSSEAEGLDLSRDGARQAWVESGGWYLQDLDFVIKYRPAGHADPFLRAWLDLGADSHPEGELFATLSAATAVGACTKCHSVEAAGGGLIVNWTEDPGAGGGLTRFSHVEHFASPSDNACLECHELAETGPAYLASYEGRDPTHCASSFTPILRSTCTQCHGAQGASAGCTTCHDYHAGAPPRAQPGAALDAVLPRAAGD